jgi:hypothetical protein
MIKKIILNRSAKPDVQNIPGQGISKSPVYPPFI